MVTIKKNSRRAISFNLFGYEFTLLIYKRK